MAPTTNSRDLWPTAGDWLRRQREACKFSQRELGRMLGHSYQSISNYERGITAPSDVTCERIAALFNVDPSEVRDMWGKYNPAGAQSAAPAPVLTLEDMIRADTRLLPEAKQHLISQIGLLLRISAQPSESTAEMLGRKLEQQERAEGSSSQDRPTPNY